MNTSTRPMAGRRSREIVCCPGHDFWYRYPPRALRRRTRGRERDETRRLATDAIAARL